MNKNKNSWINILNAVLSSEQITLNSSELSTSYQLGTYEKMNNEPKNVQNVLGVLLITILKFRNNRFYELLFQKLPIKYYFFDTLFEYSWRKNKY